MSTYSVRYTDAEHERRLAHAVSGWVPLRTLCVGRSRVEAEAIVRHINQQPPYAVRVEAVEGG